MEDNLKDKWISIETAAEYLDVKVVTVREWIKKGTGIPSSGNLNVLNLMSG